MDESRVSRRGFLLAGATSLAGLSGCAGLQFSGSRAGGERTGTSGDGATDEDATDEDATDEDAPNGDTTTDATRSRETTDGGPLRDLELRGELLARGFGSPVAVAIPQPGRTFIVEQTGQIYLLDGDDGWAYPFLDVSDRVVDISGTKERGLLGLAFHPEFADNGRFFVRYSAPSRPGTPEEYSHTFVLSEFHADPSATAADPDSEKTVLEIPEPDANHNAGAIVFGPDDYLYVGVGDGGSSGDQGTGHAEDWYDGVDGGNGQDVTENLLGSILRIDVDNDPPPGSERAYAIPDDNPLVGRDGLDEHYAWGFRNPWRMSFGPDGRLFVADVGQDAYEEVNVVEKGGNYGWNVREGTHCYSREQCPSQTADGEPLRPPIIEYPHEGGKVSGISVIGGYLYDGDEIPALQGTYVFADWRSRSTLFVAREHASGLWPVTAVPAENIGLNAVSFGRDPSGELLVCTDDDSKPSGSAGAVYRLRAS